ncbi:MAG: transposase [Pseudolabrys sp.]|nr:transposase [Pseudolabrys sp.]
MPRTRKDAEVAFDDFIETDERRYEKAADCLRKDRDALPVFHDFPAQHGKHLRTTNPIEGTCATVRHRTMRSKGCLSNETAPAMIFKLAQAAEKRWYRGCCHSRLAKMTRGVRFDDGIEVIRHDA